MELINSGKKDLTFYFILIILLLSSANSQKIIADSLQLHLQVLPAGLPCICSNESVFYKKEFSMSIKKKEIWRNIRGYEGSYQVSDLGRVRSLDRFFRNRQSYCLLKGRMKKLRLNERGYVIVGLSKQNKIRVHKVHRLVAEAFLKNKKSKPTVNHKNNIKTDNVVENLEWATYQENTDHAIKNKYWNQRGERHPLSKLTEKDVLLIRSLRPFFEVKKLAKIFGVGSPCISVIISRKAWRHI